MSALEQGGVAIFGSGEHAQMISGAEVMRDGVNLRVHNPFETTVKKIPIREFVRTMKAAEPRERIVTTIKRAPAARP